MMGEENESNPATAPDREARADRLHKNKFGGG
jgi:hypothetical protein